ncbi:hypothetical protein DPEC_G00058780 [Dallia pectoralis]|uniref:Uncharacterized protein n=1 Tax=Dallia pectoralis TaxID=75939 RepID=A0ACC2H6E0_DALPE|nr:hypothetical protein DPEC_G00058780 [Dallia pectoralis]
MGKETIRFLMIGICIIKSSCLLYINTGTSANRNSTDWKGNYSDITTKFSVRSAEEPEEDLCYLVPGVKDSVTHCSFNTSLPTFAIIHGWSVAGLLESWIHKLVTALFKRVPNANVIVVDWLVLAQHHYPSAVANTRLVGRDIAWFINWLEVDLKYDLANLHLLGYSLGAHVAGVAGNLTNNKVNRITGLDPAGPHFEYAEQANRLSPGDATFVDVLHTNTRGSPDLSIGIQRPVGHVDIYPNGGTIQPGCSFQYTLESIKNFDIYNLNQILKCSHERSVHLFIDSLVNQQQPSVAYRCSSKDAFNRGLCLSCRKNRCNNMGYGINKIRTARSTRMYLKTGAAMPFKVFHYQMKFHIFHQQNLTLNEQPITVSLFGTHGEKEDIQLVLSSVTSNTTSSFLLTTDVDLGELLRVRLQWNTDSYFSFFNSNKFMVRRMRVKAGETQSKGIFKAESNREFADLVQGGDPVTFTKSKEARSSRARKRTNRLQMHGSSFGLNGDTTGRSTSPWSQH